MNYMDMISEYIETALEIERLATQKCTNKTTKLESYIRVRKHNKLAHKLLNIATIINTEHPELKEDFFQLLYHENREVRNWVMFQILDAMDYDFEHRKKAMEAIQNRVENPNQFDNFWHTTFEIWLGNHPEYRELL